MTVMQKFTALVLAAQRPGIVNVLAEHFGHSHKCLIPVNGTPMIERVMHILQASEKVGQIVVSIEDPDIVLALPHLKAMHEAGDLTFVKSAENLAASVSEGIHQCGDQYPYLVTTADNCFHSTEIVNHFLNEIEQTGADIAWGMTPDVLVQETYPGTGKITGQHKLWDGIWSNCNIYAITDPAALKTAELFRKGGQFGNKKKRRAMIPMIGLWAFFRYRYGLITLAGMAKMASRIFGVKAHAVALPFADAPIDADDLVSFEFIEARLGEREGKAA